ncbi:hypothetical protein EU805_01865 [Salipiger sp. IMCC34102]|uniref:hypothetical protein n=1 Tax=Salipiger sp. IMCC34102 TaxID=2510647 RepID=UPI00101CCDC6|nr:hypothetical protein [Salipiger sp. IMCC34102]RYH04142.1 hypothetical protein EU805_01865 [Salipiger sp. IMCC34102]
MEGINYERDLWNAAAAALEERDVEKLEALDRLSRDWLGDPGETAARSAVLASMLDAAYTLLDLE